MNKHQESIGEIKSHFSGKQNDPRAAAGSSSVDTTPAAHYITPSSQKIESNTNLASLTCCPGAWYHQSAFLKARNHRFVDRSYTRKRLAVNAKDPGPVFHEMISKRDCRRRWAHPPLGRALHKPQQFGKKVREERTCSDAPQAAGFAGSHPTLSASKNSEKLKCDNKGTLRSCTPGSQSSSHRQPGVPGVQ